MIHPSAYIDPAARIGDNVSIGPNSYVGAGVVLGDGCILHNNVTVTGNTTCGRENVFFPNAAVGLPPQDLKYHGGLTQTQIGDDNVFRENVTVHAGTEVAGGVTRIGSHNRFLVGVHVAHDATIGNDCILSNQVQLAGHVRLEDKVTIGGIVGIHHFTTVGRLAYIGGLTRIVADVPPFMIAEGNPSRIRGFNRTGMERWGFPKKEIAGIREAFRTLFAPRAEQSGLSLLERLEQLEKGTGLNGDVSYLCAFLRRSLHDGVYGRYLEHERRDSDADRKHYYGGGEKDGGTP